MQTEQETTEFKMISSKFTLNVEKVGNIIVGASLCTLLYISLIVYMIQE